jgi:hypothetical protein
MSFYRMQRGWCDKAIFEREPYCRRAAWVWLIENAAFAPHNGLERGQIRTSFRFLAMAWRWPVAKVQRWLAAARQADMIRYTTRFTPDTPPDTRQSLITICNYSKYQLPIHLADTPPDTEPIQDPIQIIKKEIRKKEERKMSADADSARAKPPKPIATTLPEDWAPNEADRAYAVERGLNPDEMLPEWRNYWCYEGGKNVKRVDWSLTWKDRCRTLAKRQGGNGPARPGRNDASRGGVVAAMRELWLEENDGCLPH